MLARFVFLIGLLFALEAKAATVNLYVMAGQSNRMGLIVPYTPAAADSVVRLYHEMGGIDPSQEDFTYLETPAGDDPAAPRYLQIVDRPAQNLAPVLVGGHPISGSEIAFGRTLYNRYGAAHNPAIAKFAIGGSSLERDWINSPSVDLTDRMIAFLAHIRREIEAQGDTVIVRGFFWMQGEADSAGVNNYLKNLRTLVRKVRVFAGNHALPVVVARSSIAISLIPAAQQQQTLAVYAVVRAAQENFVKKDACAALINLDDLPHSDLYHFTTSSYAIIGQREIWGLTKIQGRAECQT